MNNLLRKPYLPIWMAIPVVLVFSLIGRDHTLDVRIHDSYLIIPSFHIGLLLSLVLGGIGGLYWLFRKRQLIHWLTFIHVVFTLLVFMNFALVELALSKPAAPYYSQKNIFSLSFLSMLAAIQAQVILFVNLIISLIRNKPAQY